MEAVAEGTNRTVWEPAPCETEVNPKEICRRCVSRGNRENCIFVKYLPYKLLYQPTLPSSPTMSPLNWVW